MKLIDLTGQKFGRLTVLCRDGTYRRPSGNKEPTWRCVCECGNEVVVQSSNLKRRNTLSCGCLQAENRKVPRRETEYKICGDVVYVKSFDGIEFIVNTCDLDAVLNHRWHRNGHGYMADEHGKTIHRFLMKPPAVMDVHHINENKLDNRRINLLMLSRSEHTALHQRKDVANGVTIPVYCKDCKHFDMENMECHCDEVSTDNEGGADYSLNFYLDDFCSYGERRTDGTTDHDL